MQNNDKQLPGIDVLNTGYGDFELRFDPNKPDEVQKAKETITDMLKCGILNRSGREIKWYEPVPYSGCSSNSGFYSANAPKESLTVSRLCPGYTPEFGWSSGC